MLAMCWISSSWCCRLKPHSCSCLWMTISLLHVWWRTKVKCCVVPEPTPERDRHMDAISPLLLNFIIFVLAIYVGYHVVWNVTPPLHTPLMAVTNAISAIVIVGAMLAAALTETPLGKVMGVLAVALAAVNVFGGFLVTRRMLEMFKKKERKPVREDAK